MEYLLMAMEDPTEIDQREDDERGPAYWGAWMAYLTALTEAGVLVEARGLQPAATATTVQVLDGRRHVQDGPFADTKEQLGGYFLIEVPDLDAALDWAARCPSATTGGTCEVRPVLPARP